MTTRAPRVTTLLLQRLSRALQRHIPAAIAGDDRGVHQARVTTRRLREAVPVFATGLTGSKAGKARRKIRRVTRALGTVRELDVTVQLLDELARSPRVSRHAAHFPYAPLFRLIITLAGLMSRCTTFATWAKCSASHSSPMMCTTSFRAKRSLASKNVFSSLPRTNSMTM